MDKAKYKKYLAPALVVLAVFLIVLGSQGFSIYPSGNVDWLESKQAQLEASGSSCSIEKCGRSYALFCGSDNNPSKIDSFCNSKKRTVRSFDEGECTSGSYEFCYEAEQEYGEASSEAKIEADGVYGFNIEGKWVLEKDYELAYACDGDRAYLYNTQSQEVKCNDNGCSGFVTTLEGTGVVALEDYAPIKPAIACWDRDDDDGWWAYSYVYIEANDLWVAGDWLCDTDNDCAESQQCVIGNTGSICEELVCASNQYVDDHQCKIIDESIDGRCVAEGIYTQLECAEHLVQFEEVFDEIPEEPVSEDVPAEEERVTNEFVSTQNIIGLVMLLAGVVLFWI